MKFDRRRFVAAGGGLLIGLFWVLMGPVAPAFAHAALVGSDPTSDSIVPDAPNKITLTFSNKTNPDDEVGHNWVLVKPGQEDSVLASANAAGDDHDWLDTEDPGIIAASKLIEGDDPDKVRFDAPEAGTYTFLCTFPDHYTGGMKGTLTVQ